MGIYEVHETLESEEQLALEDMLIKAMRYRIIELREAITAWKYLYENDGEDRQLLHDLVEGRCDLEDMLRILTALVGRDLDFAVIEATLKKRQERIASFKPDSSISKAAAAFGTPALKVANLAQRRGRR